MRLRILSWEYQQSVPYLVQGVKRNRRLRGAVAGGNGSYIKSQRAKIWVAVRDEEGTVSEVDMYPIFKDWFMAEDLKITEGRVERLIEYFQRQEPFEARYMDTWDEPPVSIRSIVG